MGTAVDSAGHLIEVTEYGPQADMIFSGDFPDFVYGRISDSPTGIVDDPFESFFIVLIPGQPELSQHILDFFPLVERLAAVNFIRNIPFTEGFF